MIQPVDSLAVLVSAALQLLVAGVGISLCKRVRRGPQPIFARVALGTILAGAGLAMTLEPGVDDASSVAVLTLVFGGLALGLIVLAREALWRLGQPR